MGKDPGRGELRLRLVASLLGLAAVVGAGLARGVQGAAAVEVLAIAGLFFGGTALWSARALWRRKDE